MNECRLFVTVGATLCVVSAVLAASGPDGHKNSDREIQTLQKQVAELEARIKTLENRIEKLESSGKPPTTGLPVPGVQPPTLERPGASVPNTGFLHRSGQHPKIWGEGEINGWKYYLVPLGAQ
jgi:hypothetical protein